jgi:hypothetical protein
MKKTIIGMMANRKLTKAMGDVTFDEFRRQLELASGSVKILTPAILS